MGFLFAFCQLRTTQVRRNIELHSTDTYVNYVTYVPKIENNTIKVGYFIYKCKFSTFVILDEFKRKIHRNSIKVIISLNLRASNKKTLGKLKKYERLFKSLF